VIDARVRAVLTDIEGTTGSIAFVHDVLFPYADAHLAEFVGRGGARPEVRLLLDEAAAIAEVDPHDDEGIVRALRTWIVEDRKITPLKALQGMIWQSGYERGELLGHVYDDAVAALRAWHAAGIILAIYSSGSVAAQKLLFGYSVAGNLTPLFADYFDTTVGAKTEASSYERIAAALGIVPAEGLFLSDAPGELDAARESGWATAQVLRPGTKATPTHDRIGSFAEITVVNTIENRRLLEHD
jgi:enolase-phosphatase E1